MSWLLGIAGGVLVAFVLFDAFETMILPRRVSRRLKLTRYYYKGTWTAWAGLCDRIPARRRDSLLSFYGPASLIVLFGVWAFLLILGFAMVYRSEGLVPLGEVRAAGFGKDLYYSGTTFFTLGLGDIATDGGLGRASTVIETGTGLGFLALVIGYLPVLYQAFSRREVHISLLDARASSPPTAVGLLMRVQPGRDREELDELLKTWELWCAELLESHLSYPLLAYFRSQHDHQSWVAALTALLDAGAILLAIEPEERRLQARLTFAMARHCAVDLAQIFGREDIPGERLPGYEARRVAELLGASWPSGSAGEEAFRRLDETRATYEPLVAAISRRLRMPLPPWCPSPDAIDDWETAVNTH